MEPVRLTLAQRTGNKKVTLIDNLNVYGIPASDVAHSLQKIAAASTTGVWVGGWVLCRCCVCVCVTSFWKIGLNVVNNFFQNPCVKPYKSIFFFFQNKFLWQKNINIG